MQETVSIIMPAYNAAKTINQSIDSVLNQTFSDFKLYIINDNSTDETKNIIKKIDDKRIIYLENKENKGASGSRNKGIDICEGRYIAFLDSDDIWVAEKLELQCQKLKEGWDLVCSSYKTFVDDISLVNGNRTAPQIISRSDMLKSNFIGNLTGIYNAEKLGKVRQVNKGHEDYIMWLEVIKRAKKAFCIQQSLAYYRTSSTSLSGNKLKAVQWQWEIYRKDQQLSLFKSLYYFSYYIYNAILKRK